LNNSTEKREGNDTATGEVGLIVAAYVVGRGQQFVRDAREAMGGKK
jgi:hypothetical protein